MNTRNPMRKIVLNLRVIVKAAIRASDDASYSRDAFLLMIRSAIIKTIGIKI